MANLGMISLGIKQPPRVIREVLESCSNYSCALDILSNTQMVAASYIALTGTKDNEGVIISRNRTSSVNNTYISEDNWYLVQTNDDHYLGVCNSRC